MKMTEAPGNVMRSGPPGRESALARIGRAGLAGVVAAAIAAVFEWRWTSGGASEAAPSPLGHFGLLVPVAVVVAVAVGGLAVVIHPIASPGVRRLGDWLGDGTSSGSKVRVIGLSWAPIAVVFGAAALGNFARHLLVSALPPVVIAALAALVAAAVWLALGIVVLGVAGALGRASTRPIARIRPIAFGFGAGGVLLSLGIAMGDANGDGGPLGIFGVLGREELDLRASFVLLLFVAGGYLGPAWLTRVPWFAAVGIVALGLISILVPLRFSEATALAVQRAAPSGKLSLALMRRMTDRDGDGFSKYFGGGDCDDADESRYPGADDVPGNGIDEDCSGADDKKIVLEQDEPEPPQDQNAWMREQLPSDMGLVLITIDTLRYDLGFMGYERPVSRNIDALAKRSTVFERAYALASYTGKSVGPLLIGKYPSETLRNWGHFNVFDKKEIFLRERLKKAGVYTMNVQGHWYFGPGRQGIGGGFDHEDVSASPRVPAIEGDTTVNSDKITDAAIEALSEPTHVEGRFYLWVHYVDPHATYMRHAEFDFGHKGRDLYDSEVAFTDKHIGRLLDHLEESGLSKRTVVILTSDHGEAFGEHGIYRHGRELWEEMVRVPFIIHVPGAKARRHAVRRGAIDIVPTILDLFAIDPPSGDGVDFISGQSLLADVLMPEGHEPQERIVFVDMSAGPYNTERQAFIEDGIKLHASEGRPLGLYDLDEDPEEKEDLLEKDEKLRERTLGRFKAFRRELREVDVRAP